MKKNISALLSLLLTLNLAITGCHAETDDAWKENTGKINLSDLTVSGDGISVSENTISITKGGDFEVFGTLNDGMIYVNAEEKVKLRLSGASISNSTGPAIFFDNTEKGFITITEETKNYLTDGKDYLHDEADAVIFSNDDLEIKGSGTLNITANHLHGIAGDDDVSIENGVINITSYEHGVKVNDTLSILGGNITVTSETGKGMKSDTELIIDNGTINITASASEGIESKGALTINGGDLHIVAANDGINTGNSDTSTEGENAIPTPPDRVMPSENGGARPEIQNSGNAQNNENIPPQNANGFKRGPRGEMPTPPEKAEQMPQFKDGELPPTPQDENGERPQRLQGNFNRGGGFFGMVDEETALALAITINGGNIYINAGGDGIDSNGNLIINGGNITVDGPVRGGNGPLDSQGTFEIKGGTVITTSSAGMIQLPQGSENLNILRAIFSENQKGGTVVTVKETASDTQIMSVTPTNAYQALIFASADLKADTEYAVYLNGEIYETFTAVSGTTSVGQMQGGMGRGGFGGRQNSGNKQNRDHIKVSLNGKNIRFDTQPVIKNDSTLVGFRAILEALGAEVTWDGETRTVTATKDDVTIILNIGSDTAYVNGEEKTLLAAPEIINDSTMIPVRFISEELNMDVAWDGTTKLVSITSGN